MSAPVRERCQDRAKSVAFGQAPVIQTPELGARIMRYELAYYEWTAIKPMLPNKPRGVPRVASPTGTETWYRKLVDMQQPCRQTRLSILFSDCCPAVPDKNRGQTRNQSFTPNFRRNVGEDAQARSERCARTAVPSLL